MYHPSDRRQFLKSVLGGAGALVTGGAWAASAPVQAARKASDLVPLGASGLRTSFLAQGTGVVGARRSSEHTRMGREAFTRLLRHSLDRGVQFIDMADLYGSHPYVREALEGVPRDRYALLSKIWVRSEDWVTPSGGAREEIDRFRKELGTDYLDACLVHCVLNDRWAEEYERVRDELSALQQEGVVRAVGVSCHDFGALEVAARHPWVEIIFARINHMGGRRYFMDGEREDVARVLRSARANGKAVVGMKLFGAGRLTEPEQMDASLAYAIGNDLVDAVTIGMLTEAQVDDTIERVNQTFRNGIAGT